MASSGALAIVGVIAGVMQGIPISITVMAAFCVFVAALYLAQVPSFVRAISEVRPKQRPDPEIWRHLRQYRLYEAACLLADMQPDINSIAASGDANGWYAALKQGVDAGEIERVPHRSDSKHTFFIQGYAGPARYEAYEQTVVERAELQKFAALKQVRRAFLDDV